MRIPVWALAVLAVAVAATAAGLFRARSDDVVVALLSSDARQSIFAHRMSQQLRRTDRSVRPGDIVILGDSHIQGMNVADIDPRAVNFGIGGDTSAGVLRRARAMQSINIAGAVIIAVGHNDLRSATPSEIARNVADLADFITAPVVISAIPPVNLAAEHNMPNDLNVRTAELNRALSGLCRDNACVFVSPDAFSVDSSGNLIEAEPDGVHLTPAAYARWTAALAAAVSMARTTKDAQ